MLKNSKLAIISNIAQDNHLYLSHRYTLLPDIFRGVFHILPICYASYVVTELLWNNKLLFAK